ncbi:hypothetical protein KAT24_02625 [Candidatus Pacearchaeota archaeon]|nr:hypothetical protein [Candidatus Pacearchaeota archaeon]
MKEESLVYVKLEYDEALQSKKDILSSQVNLLKIIKVIRHYRVLRLEELKEKAKMYRKIKELIANIKKIKTNFPKIKIPQLKKSDEEKEFKEKIKETQESDHDDILETQLQEIQNKLRAIGG